MQERLESTRRDLRESLLHERRAIDRVLELLGEQDPSPVELVERTEELRALVDSREPLVRALREEASHVRKREEERSVRQFVLRALDSIGAPQPAGFIQGFIWATERVDLATRGFGALRRDEARSWRRRPGHRAAYIVPALDPAGHAQARWMARSDWNLPRRLVVPGAERLFELIKLEALFRGRDRLAPTDLTDAFVPLIRGHVPQALPLGPPPLPGDEREVDWLREARGLLAQELLHIRGPVEADQHTAAKEFAGIAEEQQLWGV